MIASVIELIELQIKIILDIKAYIFVKAIFDFNIVNFTQLFYTSILRNSL